MAKRKLERISKSPTPTSDRRLEKTSDGRLEKNTERGSEKTDERRIGKKNQRPVGPASSIENADPANADPANADPASADPANADNPDGAPANADNPDGAPANADNPDGAPANADKPDSAPAGDGAPGSSAPTKPEEYIVEKVMNKRFVNGSIEYLLKWKGYSIGESTWEPLDFINALELIEEYEERVKHKTDLPNYVITNERDVTMVVGISRVIGRLEFVVKYRDGTALLVPARFANVRYPLRVIEFYERNLKMIPNIKVLREAAKRRAAKMRKN
ncbi:unnamed protein product [Auanema sp. JU1783]|nr:unnamed protein product [Auanema sp. JU1783]